MTRFTRFFSLLVITFALMGCIRVHHIQVASVDSSVRGNPIEILIENTGVDAAKVIKNLEKINQVMSGNKNPNNKISDTIAMFQTGPRTGAPIYEKTWGENLLTQLLKKCPSARLDNIYSQRLATDYGDSGITREVVLVKATCLK